MPRRRGKKILGAQRSRLPFHLEGNKTDLVCYIPPGMWYRSKARLEGPTDKGWVEPRDRGLCDRINEETGFAVYCNRYKVGAGASKDGIWKPNNWIKKNVYDVALGSNKFKNKYRRLHLVGYSAGGSLASSQVLHYYDPIVKSLVVIGGRVAEESKNGFRFAHVDAAFYADQIQPRTLLLYGKEDNLRSQAEVWRKNSPHVDYGDYKGDHDFTNQLDSVAEQVISWLKKTAIAAVRAERRKGERSKRLKRRRKRKKAAT